MQTSGDPKPAAILLEDGTYMLGRAVGAIGTTGGELCFNTGMTGYQEIFTDPSYFGQILIATNVHIGNYGIKDAENESDSIKIAGLICRNFNVEFSRNLADTNIQQYFEKYNLVGIDRIDTRALVKHIREKGAMNAVISSETTDKAKLQEELNEIPSMDGMELASHVTTETAYDMGESDGEYRIAVLDYGVKQNILRNFDNRNCTLRVFPAKTTADEVRAWNPDGYFLSNGPGDPAAMPYAIETAKSLLEDGKPLFGICLGHQILALALGMKTYKMHHGHRGINHPVKNLVTGRCEITSQNHGFGVHPDEFEKADNIEVTHINLNDQTVEGLAVKGKPAFSVQYHPEASPGPHDANYLFDQYINLLKENK